MMRWIVLILVAGLILLATPASQAGPLVGSIQPQAAASDNTPHVRARIEPALLKQVLTSSPDQTWPILVVMQDQAPAAPPSTSVLSPTPPGDARQRRAAARAALVEAWRDTAQRSQQGVRAFLAAEQNAGRAKAVRSFWIFNGLAVQATPQTVWALAARDDVALVRRDAFERYVPDRLPVSVTTPLYLQSPTLAAGTVEWGVKRVHADQVWSAFNITGSGVIVANMDTGVYWDHPALKANYRGYMGKGLDARHTGNWFDATGEATLQPYDGEGHGTHTMGTLAGQGGIGVAPGARWIAARIFDSQGYGYDSWIHTGFEWMLAPAGRPELAPDVLSNSWGSALSSSTEFQADLARLRQAGIFVVFSAGNKGPDAGSINAPAALPGGFAVGAIDADDEIAWFSSRGPSPWNEIKPEVVAPGVNIRSSMPGGTYGLNEGTSMATPHVAGVAALMLAADPGLDVDAIETILTSTAASLGGVLPNNDSGWGLVDAYAAVQAVADAGVLAGQVVDAGSRLPLPGAAVRLHGDDSGQTFDVQTDAQGRFQLGLAAGPYSLTATQFGYSPAVAEHILVFKGQTSITELRPQRLPTGVLSGVLTDTLTGRPVTVTLSALNTPFSRTAYGEYLFKLPVGSYTLQARALGYRVLTALATVSAGQETRLDFGLLPIPRILLVHAGAWYYREYPGYLRPALDALSYTYDEWRIKDVLAHTPSITDLLKYDIVMWSSPEDSPAYIAADATLEQYMSSGGMLMLTGQDIAFWDGGGTYVIYAPYLRNYLKTNYVRDDAEVRHIAGLSNELMAGLTFDIQGGDGANNQVWPDVIAVTDPSSAAQTLTYQQAGLTGQRVGSAGQKVGLCLPYRAVVLPFGYEAIADPASRRDLMRRIMDYFTSPRLTAGLSLAPVSPQTQVSAPGTQLTFTVSVRNIAELGAPVLYTATLDSSAWTATLSPTHLTLSPCTSAELSLVVSVPTGLGLNVRNPLTLTVQTPTSPPVAQSLSLLAKTPAPVLFVDDDRWHNIENAYLQPLDQLDIPYDVWKVAWEGSEEDLNGPPFERLRWYPIVVWATGNDWYRPLAAYDETQLAAYLSGGGRLLLSSVFYLDTRGFSNFARRRLGVLDHTYGLTATFTYGSPGHPLGSGFEPVKLVNPFPRTGFFTLDYALVPDASTETAWRGDHQRAHAIARSQPGNRLIFWGIPLEALPADTRGPVLQRSLGWLGSLGDSSVQVNPPVVRLGQPALLTLQVRNNMSDTQAALTARLPAGVSPDTTALPLGFSYTAGTNTLAWSGPSYAGKTLTFKFLVSSALTGTNQSPGEVVFRDMVTGLEFDQPLRLRVEAPDLQTSLIEPPQARALRPTTIQMRINNRGPGLASSAVVTSLAPLGSPVISDSARVDGPGRAWVWSGGGGWQGRLEAGQSVTVTYQVTAPYVIGKFNLPVEMLAWDDAQAPQGQATHGYGAWEWRTWMEAWQTRVYLPLALREGGGSKE